MNELQMLAQVREQTPPMSIEAKQRGRAALAVRAGERPARTAGPSPVRAARRLGWRVAVPAMALGAAAIAAGALVLPADPPAAVTPAGEVLLVAAAAAQERPVEDPAPEQFTYHEIVQYPSYGMVDDYVWEIAIWISVDGSRPGAVQTTSVDECTAPDPGPCTSVTEIPAGGQTELDDPLLPYAYLTTLPTDPEALMEQLVSHAGGDWEQVWYMVRSLAGSLPPPQLAALYEGAATVPGIELLPEVTDAAGRTGVGVGRPVPTLGDNVIIFDPVTYAYLGEQSVDEDGEVTFDRALLRTGVVDEVGQVPG